MQAVDTTPTSIPGEFLRRAGDGRAVAGFHRASFGVDVEEEARRISVPTLVLHARDDRAIELEAGRRLASLIPNARFEVVEGDHLDGTGGSAETRARVMAFLNE